MDLLESMLNKEREKGRGGEGKEREDKRREEKGKELGGVACTCHPGPGMV